MVTSYKKLFGKTALLTTFIFLIGIFVGRGIDELRSDEVFDTLQDNELDTQSYLIEQEFLDNFAGDPCALAQIRLRTLSEELGELGYYLVNYEKKNIFVQKRYEYLLRKYFLLEIRAYTFFTELNKECQLDNTLILYFFDPEDFSSQRQGKVLDVLVKKNDRVSVFSINVNYKNDPTIETVKLHHNITKVPTLIIDGSRKIESFVDLTTLEPLLQLETA